mmetsp:Transcript_13521/g.26074  ORF Transcript_13521/g.26074 Transcript_13521/m.26074 type:complete len:247 (+) Transcript_13521:79-819(+)|eukprot:CAMPEP_0171499202 /NCGR_PEP_ID=MMETSP0958-20121227/8300_1 /TAXON_ID=87120 /ORGANISM="Aurantiochytrium limacinum, Strain ATCCMYA-1381" /LENGTH=246 /DNA_ID=CAMNT_0012033737 /DNA_START=92 /DNA_END=832 /DNA_ORIENTATION=+
MKLAPVILVAAAVIASSVEVVQASTKYVWVPTEACESPVKLCYEGARDDVIHISRSDPMNPCYKNAKVVQGSCNDFGYSHHISKDELFQNIDVYGQEGNKQLAENHMQSRNSGVNNVFDHLENVGTYSGVCWRQFTERVKGIHMYPCNNVTEDDQLGICYPKCATGGEGVGPICLEPCGGIYPISVGALCCQTQATCNKMLQDIGVKLAYDLGKVAMDHASTAALLEDLRKLAMDARGLILPECKV